MSYLPIILVVLSGLILTIGDIAMKEWVLNSKHIYYILGLAIYVIGLMFLAQTFKYKNIAVASIMVVIFNVVILSIVSWIFFKEDLSFMQIVGILLGLASVGLLKLTT